MPIYSSLILNAVAVTDVVGRCGVADETADWRGWGVEWGENPTLEYK